MPTVHLLIKGKVQGVYYRASAREEAQALGLTGWVRNTPEGDVEAVASGDQVSIDKFIAWCHRGPRQSKVVSVEVSQLPEEGFEGFAIRRGS